MMPTIEQFALLAFLAGSEAMPLDKPAVMEGFDRGVEISVPYDNLLQCLDARERLPWAADAACVTSEGDF